MRKKFTVRTSLGDVEVVTQSERRYVVVDVGAPVPRIVKRSDNSLTAENERRKYPTRRVVYDTKEEVFR